MSYPIRMSSAGAFYCTVCSSSESLFSLLQAQYSETVYSQILSSIAFLGVDVPFEVVYLGAIKCVNIPPKNYAKPTSSVRFVCPSSTLGNIPMLYIELSERFSNFPPVVDHGINIISPKD